MAVRSRQSPWTAKSPGEQEPGAGGRSAIAQIEKTRVKGWGSKEGCYECARFAVLLLLFAWSLSTSLSQ